MILGNFVSDMKEFFKISNFGILCMFFPKAV